jgi:hypothetical protein
MRLVVAIAAGCALLLLLTWQIDREMRIRRCLDAGGGWDGPNSRCIPHPSRIIIQRDLHRS